MNQTLIHTAFALALGSAALTAHAAALPYGAQLTITAGVPTYDSNGDLLTISSGSWFGIDFGGNNTLELSERFSALSQGTTGFIIGMPTPPGASHPGPPVPGDTNQIDAPYDVFGETASDYTTIGITGGTATGLDMSGWVWRFYGMDVPMGTGAWGAGFSNGIGNFSWSGILGDTYTLDYRARVPFNDPTGFGGVGMAWHYEGVVGIPEPATYGMMLAGLGLVGFAVRRHRREPSRSGARSRPVSACGGWR